VDVAAQNGTLQFKGIVNLPAAPQDLSCRAVVDPNVSIICATEDHSFAATIDGHDATLWSHGVPLPVTVSCTPSGSLPPTPPDARARIHIGRYVDATPTGSGPVGTCDFDDALILDKTVIGGDYVVSIVHQPGTYCTPLDIAKKPAASFAIVSVTQQPCFLDIHAVDASGRGIDIQDSRVQEPQGTDSSGCPTSLGDLHVITTIPDITNDWRQSPV
jgi:hypothetical protein